MTRKSSGLMLILLPFLVVAIQTLEPLMLWEKILMYSTLYIGCNRFIDSKEEAE